MENVVLDDNLYLELRKYREGADPKTYSRDKIAKILRFSGNSILTNVAQWKRLDIDLDCQTGAQLLHQKTKNAPLEDLCMSTKYKIILTDDPARTDRLGKTLYPYVNIDKDEIEMVLGGFVMRGASRVKATAHLKALCRDARKVLLHDKYFYKSPVDNTRALRNILPAHKLDLHYHEDGDNSHLNPECLKNIKTVLPNVTLHPGKLTEHHDRYLIIDDKTEIVLTSGFSYLTNSMKEISYIVRDYGNRF